MSKVVNFGKVQITKADPFDWSNDKTYEKLELVRHNGFVYLCVNNTYVEGISLDNEEYFLRLGYDNSSQDSILDHVSDMNNPHNTQLVNTSKACTGNSATATKLAKAVNVTLSGDVSGSTTFDGSNNIAITTVVANNSHTHTTANITGLQDTLNGLSTTYATKSYLETFVNNRAVFKGWVNVATSGTASYDMILVIEKPYGNSLTSL